MQLYTYSYIMAGYFFKRDHFIHTSVFFTQKLSYEICPNRPAELSLMLCWLPDTLGVDIRGCNPSRGCTVDSGCVSRGLYLVGRYLG